MQVKKDNFSSRGWSLGQLGATLQW